MSGGITITNACTGFPNPISTFFFLSCFSCILKLEETPKVLCSHLITSGGRAGFTQLLRGEHIPFHWKGQWQAVLVVSFSRSKLERIFAHQRCCHSSASSSSWNTRWKELWTALERLSEGKGREVHAQSKHVLHENNMSELSVPLHTALKLILLSAKAYSCVTCCIYFNPVCSCTVISVFMLPVQYRYYRVLQKIQNVCSIQNISNHFELLKS